MTNAEKNIEANIKNDDKHASDECEKYIVHPTRGLEIKCSTYRYHHTLQSLQSSNYNVAHIYSEFGTLRICKQTKSGILVL